MSATIEKHHNNMPVGKFKDTGKAAKGKWNNSRAPLLLPGVSPVRAPLPANAPSMQTC